jgi:hypothetical protein
MTSIFMVIGNCASPGAETIYGLYPTQELAEARADALMADPDYQGDDFCAVVVEANVGPNGADTVIALR